MLRRTLMRRAYNSGRWVRARHYAQQIISKPKEQQLARSVIIRSYWNEGNYRKVRELNTRWNNEFDHLLNRNAKKSMTAEDGTQTHSPQVKAWHVDQPSPLETFEFDEYTMENNFSQEGNRVWMRHPNGWTFWDMPEQFELEKTHVDLLRLVAEILLSWYFWRY